MRSETILILYANYGDGHRLAAKAIQSSLSGKYPGAQIVLADFMQLVHPYFYRMSRYLFVKGVQSFPDIYGFVYNQTRAPRSLSEFMKKLNRFGKLRLLNLLQTLEPSVVVSTFPLAAATMSFLKTEGLTQVPTTTVITDHTDHSYWVYPLTNQYLVGSEMVKEGLLKQDVPRQRIAVTGIPVRREFAAEYEGADLAGKHGLDPGMPTFLLMGGGCGIMKDGKALVKSLETLPRAVQLIVICGRNEKLRLQLEELAGSSRHRIVVKGYVDYVHELMAVSDVIITKPGGLTVSEALAMELPMILFHPLPGQEADNTRFLLASGAAVHAKTVADLVDAISECVLKPAKLEQLRAQIRRIQKKDAALQAGRLIWQSRSDVIADIGMQTLVPFMEH